MSNKIMILWSVIVVAILASVFLIGRYRNINGDYILLTKTLKESTKEYLESTNSYPDRGQSVIIESEQLKDEYLKEDLKLDDKECTAVITVTKKILYYKYNFVFTCL